MPNPHEIFWSNYRVMRRHIKKAEGRKETLAALRAIRGGPFGVLLQALPALQYLAVNQRIMAIRSERRGEAARRARLA